MIATLPATPVRVPELLAPAGDWEAMRAAVANGADAVYFGLAAFNARHRATNFAVEALPEVIAYLHGHNVRGYITLNTLIFSDELPRAVEWIQSIAAVGADAVIVQDLGLAKLISQIAPTLSVHGSTQMTLTEPLGVEWVKSLGVSRVILARELSVAQVRAISAATDMPVEVFVHGALCVAYSGQCLTSEALGGRSANRGQCAQACRLPYSLIVDGQALDLGDRAYLLSPQDLAAYDCVADLAEAGVSCVKIEGRLKSAQYVAAATQAYRAAIDATAKHETFAISSQMEMDLAQSFSRGFTHGFLDGVNHQALVHARFPKSRGMRAGTVTAITSRGVLVEVAPKVTLKSGDGVVFDQGHPEQDEQGGRIYAVRPMQRGVEITFGLGNVNIAAVEVGSTVWKTDDPAVRRRLEASYGRDLVARRVPLGMRVHLRTGEPLKIEAEDERGHRVSVIANQPLELAQKHPVQESVLREQLGRLGDTPFALDRLIVEPNPPEPVMVPKSLLNDLRRQAMEQLLAMRSAHRVHAVAQPDALEQWRERIAPRVGDTTSATGATQPTPNLYVLVRSMAQLETALAWQPPAGLSRPMIYCEFEDIRLYPQAVSVGRARQVPVGLATLRIVKPEELGLLRQIGRCDPDAILVRNLASVAFFKAEYAHVPLIGDYALNIANELTADLMSAAGLRRMVPSYDLSWTQLTAMMGRFSPAQFEVVIHQHMPMFYMEHCVFCNTLSTGKDYHDCGRPCETHQVSLRDRAGALHALLADAGCRNTVYNAAAQSAAEFVPQMMSQGLRHFRVELLRETPEQVAPLLDRYANVLLGNEDGRTTWRQLRVLNQLGVTRGTLRD